MARQKTTLLLDPDFKSFIEYLKETNGTPLSRILEIATIEKYKKEYEIFLKNKVKEGKNV